MISLQEICQDYSGGNTVKHDVMYVHQQIGCRWSLIHLDTIERFVEKVERTQASLQLLTDFFSTVVLVKYYQRNLCSIIITALLHHLAIHSGQTGLHVCMCIHGLFDSSHKSVCINLVESTCKRYVILNRFAIHLPLQIDTLLVLCQRIVLLFLLSHITLLASLLSCFIDGDGYFTHSGVLDNQSSWNLYARSYLYSCAILHSRHRRHTY